MSGERRDYLPLFHPQQYAAPTAPKAANAPLQVTEWWKLEDKVRLVDQHGQPLLVERPRPIGFGR